MLFKRPFKVLEVGSRASSPGQKNDSFSVLTALLEANFCDGNVLASLSVDRLVDCT